MYEFFCCHQFIKCTTYCTAGYNTEGNLRTRSHQFIQELVSTEYVIPHEIVSLT